LTSRTLAEAERAVTFWQTLGSFGFPMLALGGHVVWSAHQRRRVPGWLGGIVLAWGLPFVTALPTSPGLALPVIGGLIIAGDTDGRGRSRPFFQRGIDSRPNERPSPLRWR